MTVLFGPLIVPLDEQIRHYSWVAAPRVTLRNVQPDDAEIYVRLRCDPAIMKDLGGPQQRAEVLAKVERDCLTAQADAAWILMIVPDATTPAVAGTVVVWTNEEHGQALSEIGWMVLPEFQGQGIAKAAVAEVLQRALGLNRWGSIHAFPSVTNDASNALCQSLGFHNLGRESIDFAGQQFVSNHWCFDPSRA